MIKHISGYLLAVLIGILITISPPCMRILNMYQPVQDCKPVKVADNTDFNQMVSDTATYINTKPPVRQRNK